MQVQGVKMACDAKKSKPQNFYRRQPRARNYSPDEPRADVCCFCGRLRSKHSK